MKTRRAFLGLAGGAAALAGVTTKAVADVPAIRTLSADEVSIEGGSLRFNMELAGWINDVVANDRYVYISLSRKNPAGPYSIVRWAGGTNPVELIYGTIPDQDIGWNLRTNPAGRILAATLDAVVVLG